MILQLIPLRGNADAARLYIGQDSHSGVLPRDIECLGEFGFFGWDSVGGVRDRVVIVVCECIWNGFTVLHVLPNLDNTGSLGYPPRRMAYHPLSSNLIIASRFLAGNREA